MNIIDRITGKDEKDSYAAAPLPTRLRKESYVAILTADNVEDIEFFYPYYRLNEAGYLVDVITPKGGRFSGKHGLGLSQSLSVNEVNPSDYAMLYIPGGKAPAELARNERALHFVWEFAQLGRPIAAICHGVQVLIEADLVHGRQMACWPEIAQELVEAGGIFVDEALVVDGRFITARRPGDLHRHLYGVLHYLEGKLTNQPRPLRQAS